MGDGYKRPVSEKKIKFKSTAVGSKKSNRRWIAIITATSLVLSAMLSLVSSEILQGVGLITAGCIILFIVIVGIISDMIGIAVTAADETPFHAMASRKFYGAKQSIMLIRNANKVSSICNDVIGDICGIISGTATALIALRIAAETSSPIAQTLIGLAATGVVAAVTIGGKAMGKTVAMQHSNYIVYKVGVVLTFLTGRFQNRRLGKSNK